MEKREPSCIVGGNVNWYSHYGEQLWRFLKTLGIKLSYDPTITLLGIYPEESITEKDTHTSMLGFPDSSVGKESACNAGDPSWIPGLGRSTGEGMGYPLQYSQASLVAQLVKNPPAMRETWVQSLGWEDPLEKGKATHFSILAWRIPWTV